MQGNGDQHDKQSCNKHEQKSLHLEASSLCPPRPPLEVGPDPPPLWVSVSLSLIFIGYYQALLEVNVPGSRDQAKKISKDLRVKESRHVAVKVEALNPF